MLSFLQPLCFRFRFVFSMLVYVAVRLCLSLSSSFILFFFSLSFCLLLSLFLCFSFDRFTQSKWWREQLKYQVILPVCLCIRQTHTLSHTHTVAFKAGMTSLYAESAHCRFWPNLKPFAAIHNAKLKAKNNMLSVRFIQGELWIYEYIAHTRVVIENKHTHTHTCIYLKTISIF